MNKCPNCHKSTITLVEKMLMGPTKIITCDHCDTKISVPWWSMIVYVLLFAIVILLNRSVPTLYFLIGSGLALLVAVYVQLKFIPLVIHSSDPLHKK